MANPLDMVTQDDSEELSPFDQAKMRGISIRPAGSGPDVASAGNDPLTKMVAPQPPTDIMAIIQLVKDRLLGTGGQERHQLWPERMVRSGLTLPGDVMSGAEPIVDPATGRTSERVIERAQDVAGLAGGSALAERPGAASMGSGPVRQFRRGANENLNPDMPNAPEFYVKPSRDELFVAPVKKEYKAYPEIDNPNKWRVIEISHDAYSQTSKDFKSGLSPDAAEAEAAKLTADSPAKYVVAGGKGDPHIGQQFKSEAEAKAFVRQNRKTVHDLYMRDPRMVEAGGRGHQGEDLHLTGFDTPEQAHEALAHLNSGGNYDLTNGFKMLPGKGTVLRSDTQQPGAAISGAASSAPVFYSALEHAATNAAQETMSPQQWLGYLKNQPGVKAEELNWTGIGDWLNGQKGKVSKNDVQQYLDGHKVEIKDVTKQQGKFGQDELDNAHEWAGDQMLDDLRRNPDLAKKYPDLDSYLNSAEGQRKLEQYQQSFLEQSDSHGLGETKYSSYQLPGGENYREHLLTLPRKQGDPQAFAKKMTEKYGGDNYYNKMTPEELAEFDKVFDGVSIPSKNDYQSSHWDEPNVLAHVRTNDRDVGGQKSLHIEEIQSDWHQQGRKQGYKDSLSKEAVEEEAKAMASNRLAGAKDGWGALSEEGKEIWRKLVRDRGVPDAPFKTTWPELALKRMVRHAAENGYDRISWTPGEAQAARYDLSKTIEKVQYHHDKQRLVAFDKGMNTVVDKVVSPDKIANYIGKDAADKLINEPTKRIPIGNEFINELRNADLKAGGEGMREFYDKMLPKMAEKIGKAHGVKVKTTEAINGGKEQLSKNILSHPKLATILDEMQYNHPTRSGWSEAKAHKFLKDLAKNDPEKFVKEYEKITGNYDDPHMKISSMDDVVPALHYFDLPQSLKDHAIGKGFPLYMSGVPFPLTPVDHDPFKEKK